MPAACPPLDSWLYAVRTGQGAEVTMFYAGNPAGDNCVDLCNACTHLYDKTWLCQTYDAHYGWTEFRRGPWKPSCQRCNPLGYESNVYSRGPLEPVTGDCSLP